MRREPGAASSDAAAGGGQMNSRSSRLSLTGSRAFGRWPAPSSVTSAPPVASASASPCVSGRTRSRSPWMTSIGHRTRSHIAREVLVARPGRGPRVVSASVSGVVSSAQPTQSSICLVECGSLKHLAKKNSRKPEVVPLPVVAVVLGPALVGVERLVEAARRARDGPGRAGPPGRCRRSRRPARGGRRRGSSPTARRTTAPPASRARSRWRPSPRARRRRTRRCCSPRRRPAGPSGHCPRPSKVTTRQWRARYGIWSFQKREWTIDQVGSSSTVGSPSP